MNETTVRGNIISHPSNRRAGGEPVCSFRVASNSRYQDKESGEWKNGTTLYFTATCWARLAEKVGGKVFKGDAVILTGRLQTNEYERDGSIRRDLEMRVTAVGADLARMDVSPRRERSGGATTSGAGEGAVEGSGGDADADEADGSVNQVGSVEVSESDDDEVGAGADGAPADVFAGAVSR